MTTADDLPDDVVERAAEAMIRGSAHAEAPERWNSLVRRQLAALLDAEPPIVALVPDPDTDAIEALGEATDWAATFEPLTETVRNLNAAGWTVARLTDVQRQCDERGRTGTVVKANHDNVVQKWVCPTCGGSGERPADPQHDHDPDEFVCGAGGVHGSASSARDCVATPPIGDQHHHDPDECAGCADLEEAAYHMGAMRHMRPDATPPPAGDLPGDGWVRYRIADDATYVRHHDLGWWRVTAKPGYLDLHPDPEPEPRPTEGWKEDITQNTYASQEDGWFWSLHNADFYLVAAGTVPTREEAEQAAAQARAAWDARLAGGAS